MNKELQDIQVFAKRIRQGDWTAPFSDSLYTTRRWHQWLRDMAETSKLSPNHTRLWELCRGFEENFTWWEDKKRPDWQQRTADRFEAGWRWAGAYLWVHGVKVSEEEAKALVGAPSSKHPKYNHIEMTGQPDWEKIDEMVGGE